MKLKNLLEGVEVLTWNASAETDVHDIKIDSRTVENGDLFVCLVGNDADGHDFASAVSERGGLIVAEHALPIKTNYVVVENTRKAYSIIAQNFFGNPAKHLRIVGVVGTNGKTSTSHILEQILTYSGIRTGLIGTLGYSFAGEREDATLTTPDPYKFNQILAEMLSKGAEVVVTEVSAHAIALQKLFGIRTEMTIFTNVTQDHLDYFKTFEEYAKTKLSYFTAQNTELAIVNLDDAYGKKLQDAAEIPVVTYGLESPAEVFAIDVRPKMDGISFVLNLFDEILDVSSPLYGYFNVYNLIAAIIAAKLMSVPSDAILKAVRRIREIDGRFNILKSPKGMIIIDYAHTPDGLRNLLSSARMITKGQLITVFGCGGNRDRTKRPVMGKIASEYSDFVVLTSDNPRDEEPIDIIHDIEKGVRGSCKAIVNRADAITYAMQEMMEGDTVVIAGKGAEKYIEVRGERRKYSDYDVVYRRGGRRE